MSFGDPEYYAVSGLTHSIEPPLDDSEHSLPPLLSSIGFDG